MGGFHVRLRQARESRELSRAELATVTSIGLAHVTALELDSLSPVLTVVERLAEALLVTPEWLAFGVGDGPHPTEGAA